MSFLSFFITRIFIKIFLGGHEDSLFEGILWDLREFCCEVSTLSSFITDDKIFLETCPVFISKVGRSFLESKFFFWSFFFWATSSWTSLRWMSSHHHCSVDHQSLLLTQMILMPLEPSSFWSWTWKLHILSSCFLCPLLVPSREP